MAKTDLDSAFRNLPMSRETLSLLGIKIEDLYYLETCLPFGSSESCAIFEKFATWLEWEVTRRSMEELSHYLDDYIFIHQLLQKCQLMLDHFYNICSEINFLVAHQKTEGPCTCLTFFSLTIDSIKMLILVPEAKVQDALEKIEYLLKTKKVRVSSISSLAGLLNFICKAV